MKKLSLYSFLSLFLLSACGGPVDATPHSLGNADAPVLIEEFSDFQCPACAFTSPQVEKFVKDNPDLARFEYKHFPLSFHEYAFAAAEAAECAGDQGKFFEYSGVIFENQTSLSEDYLYKAADSLDLDRDTFDACLDNRDKKAKVLNHVAEGNRRGVDATPTLFVNGEKVRFSGIETFEAYIRGL